MKEILSEYYKINIDLYKEYNDGIIFFVNGYNYYLCKCNYDEEYLKYINNFIHNINIKLHGFVFNKDNNILSNGYILLKLNYLIDKITLEDVNKYNIVINNSEYISIRELWLRKIDYYEDKIDLNNNYNYDYYSGIIEMLMSYFKIEYKGSVYLTHKKLYLDTVEFYNPMYVTLDLKLRDIASYIVLNKDYDLLYKIITNLNDYERLFLFCRLIIPYKYFELLDDVITKELDDKELVKYINNYKVYEDYVRDIEKIFNINIFKWIKKE